MSVGNVLTQLIEKDKAKQKTGTSFNEDSKRLQLRLSQKEQDLRYDVWVFRVDCVADLSRDQRKVLNEHFDRLVYRAGLQLLTEYTPESAIARLLRAYTLEKPRPKGGAPRK